MNTFIFEDQWNQIKGKLKQRYAQFADDDLEFVQGKGEELLGRIQSKLGLSEESVVALLNQMKDSATSAGHGVREKVSEATARVGEVVGDVKSKVSDAAGDAYGHARESARRYREKAETYVTHEPLKAVLTAFAVGLVAGLAIRR